MQIQVSWMNISLVGGTWVLWLPHHIGKNNPNWRTHIFQRGRSTTNQSFIRSSRSHGRFETWCSCWIWCSDISQGAFQSTRSHPFGGAALKTSDDSSQLNHWLMGVPVIDCFSPSPSRIGRDVLQENPIGTLSFLVRQNMGIPHRCSQVEKSPRPRVQNWGNGQGADGRQGPGLGGAGWAEDGLNHDGTSQNDHLVRNPGGALSI